MQKAALRQLLKKDRPMVGATEVLRQFEALPIFQAARTICVFVSSPKLGEPPTQSLLDLTQKQVVVPRLSTENSQMEGVLKSETSEWAQGPFGIWQLVGEPLADLSLIDLVVVPGVAFSHQKDRLGRGGGYYDRFLADLMGVNPSVWKVGLCFQSQFGWDFQTEPHDIKMDELVVV